MPNNNRISNKDIYDAINGLRVELGSRIDKVEIEVKENTDWRNKVTGQIVIIMILIGTAANFVVDYFRGLINNN